MGLAIAGKQWLIEVLCFHFTFVLDDSLVLLNARHRQAPNNGQHSLSASAVVFTTIRSHGKYTLLERVSLRIAHKCCPSGCQDTRQIIQ
jgi:hypothetical protein